MDKLIQILVESKLLTEGTIDSVRAEVEQIISEVKQQTEAEVKATLTEQWIAEREVLVESLDAKMTDLLENEINELKDDIKSFRDLEVEYAVKLEDEKTALNESYETKLSSLIETLDVFIERRLAVELQEFATDLEQVKKNEFATQMFEAFAPLFQERFLSEDETHNKLKQTEQKLAEAQQSLKATQKLQESAERQAKMTNLLSTLSESQHTVMKTLLEGVATDQLDTMFEKYITVVVERSALSKGTKDKLVTEGAKATKQTQLDEGVVVTGNKPVISQPQQTNVKDQTDRMQQVRKLAGLV